jgi:acetyl esterase/lipase
MTTTTADRGFPQGRAVTGGPARGPLLIAAAGAGAGAAACYLVMLPAYAQTSVPAAIWWAVAGLSQLGLAIAVLQAPSRPRLAAAAGVSGILAVICLIVRLTGSADLKNLLWQPVDTAAGFTDVTDTVLQLLAAGLLTLAAVRWPRRRAHNRAWVVIATVLLMLPAVVLTAAGITLATDGFVRVTAPAGGDLNAHQVLPPGTSATLTYCTTDGVPLTMQVFEPPASALRQHPRPAPAVVYVHGGGLILGNRQLTGLGASLANHDGALFPQLRAGLTAEGMVVATIDYRLAPLAPWPAQIRDAACAVRFLRAHAAALGITPARIGAWGSSGGGSLATLLGIGHGFDTGQYPGYSSRVQAVVDMFEPSDFNAMRHAGLFSQTVIQIALGSSATVRASASPITYVAAGDPPVLILHGTADPVVPTSQSADFYRKLTAAGVPATLIWMRGAGHGANTPGQVPSPEAVAQTVISFFARTLR